MAKLRNFRVQPSSDDDGSGGEASDLSNNTAEGAEEAQLYLPDKTPSLQPIQVSADPSDAAPAPTTAPGDIDLPDKMPQLSGVYDAVKGTDPDRAAKVLALQQRINEPAAFIDKNLDSVQKAANAPSTSFFKQLEDQYPGTTQFLSDPKNMAVAQDDIPNVAQHESLIQQAEDQFTTIDRLKQAFELGAESSIPGLLYRQKLPDVAPLQNPNVVERLATNAGSFAGDFGPMIGLGLAGAAAGGAAGGPVGAFVGGAAGGFGLPAAIKNAIEQKFKNGEIVSYSDILKEFAKQSAVGLATGGGAIAGNAVGGTLGALAGENVAMTVAGKGVEGQVPKPSDLVDNLLLTGAAHGITHGVAGIPGMLETDKAQAAKDFYTALGDTAEASKLRARLPEAHQQLVADLTKDGPVENVYIPAEAAQSYFQSKNLDPDTVMSDLGVSDSFNEAKATGGDVQIPLATWVNKIVGTEHYQGLADDIKFDPEDMTPRQVGARKAEIQAQVQSLMDQQKQEQAAQAAEDQHQARAQDITSTFQKIQDQLKAAGLSGPELEFNPQLHEAFYNTMGEHMGVDPAELAERFPLQIGRAPDSAATEAAAPDEQMAAQNQDGQTLEQGSVPVVQEGSQGALAPNGAETPTVLEQGAPKLAGPRGRIRIGQEGYAIDLFKNADRSTFLHETGHYFLDVMGHLSEDEKAPQGLKDDYQTILKWLGVGSKDEIGTDEHEKFARGFEQYLMEGKAPSSALERAFSRFRKWLTSVYQSAKNLNVDMSDDVRGVMDRMLASRDAIDQASRHVGLSGDSVKGLPPEIQEKILDLQSKARDQAESALMKEQMKELTAKHQEFLESERERQTEKAQEEVKELPVFKAGEEASLEIGRNKKSGEGDDSVVTGARPGTVAEKFLSDKLEPEDAGKFEAIAVEHGFDSGEELAHSIIMAEEQKTFQVEVNARVEAGMAPHAGLLDPANLRAEALSAVHGEKMTELLALEREALSRLTNKAVVNQEVSRRNRIEARVEAAAAKEQARDILAQKPIKDAANARPYLTAERNAAVKAAKALARGDYEAASEAKRQQMLNHAIASEAMRNRTEVDKTASFLSDYAKRKNDLMKMPYGFMRQVDQLLSRFGFAEPRNEDAATLTKIAQDMTTKGEDPAEIANRTGYRQDATGNWVPETLPDFVARANDNYYALQLPDSVMGSGSKSYEDLTLSDIRDVKDAVKTIADLGKKYDRFLGEFKTMDVKAAAAAFKASIAENYGTPMADEMKPGSSHASELGEMLAGLSHLPEIFNRQLDMILTTCNKFDGVEYEGMGKFSIKEGPAKEFIYRPLEDAANRETARTAQKMKELDGILAQHYDLDEFAKYKDTRINVDGRYFTKDEILSMALNWGNEANRDRLMRGFGFDEAKMERIFQNLGKNDWDFAQSIWNHIDQYWPEIKKLEMDVNGVEPGKVPALPFENAHGKYEGGYYPIKYDFEKSADAYKNEQSRDALYRQFSTAAAATEQGHAKSRVANVTRPLLLDLGVIKAHHEDVIHDLEFRRAVIDVNRFLNQKDVKSGITDAVGVRGYSGIQDWLKDAAGGGSEPLTPFDQAAQWFRFKTTFFNLGYRIVSAPKIAVENMINVANELNVSGTARAIKDYYLGDSGMHDQITEKSEFMRMRGEHLDRDLSDIQDKWQKTGEGPFKKFAFFVHAYLDQGTSFPLWADAYKRAMGYHGDEKLAVNQADEAVKRTFMSGGAADQPAVMRGGEKQKALTTAFGYQSMMWNRFSMQKFAANQAWIQGNHTAAVAIAARATVYTFLLPALTAALTAEFMRNKQTQSDDDEKKRMIGRFAEEATPLKFVPVLRDMAPYLIRQAMGERGSDLQFTPLEEAAQTILTPMGEAAHAFGGHGLPDKFPEHTANAISLFAGVPKEINDLTFNFIDWQKNNGALTWRDFVSRKTKK